MRDGVVIHVSTGNICVTEDTLEVLGYRGLEWGRFRWVSRRRRRKKKKKKSRRRRKGGEGRRYEYRMPLSSYN